MQQVVDDFGFIQLDDPAWMIIRSWPAPNDHYLFRNLIFWGSINPENEISFSQTLYTRLYKALLFTPKIHNKMLTQQIIQNSSPVLLNIKSSSNERSTSPTNAQYLLRITSKHIC